MKEREREYTEGLILSHTCVSLSHGGPNRRAISMPEHANHSLKLHKKEKVIQEVTYHIVKLLITSLKGIYHTKDVTYHIKEVAYHTNKRNLSHRKIF